MPVRFILMGPTTREWQVNLMPAGKGRFYLYLNGLIRTACAVRVGDRVRARVRFDAAYRGGPLHTMPAEFEAGLDRSVAARRAWDALSPSRQKEILRYLATLKTPESHRRNICRALMALRGEHLRFLGREWGG